MVRSAPAMENANGFAVALYQIPVMDDESLAG